MYIYIYIYIYVYIYICIHGSLFIYRFAPIAFKVSESHRCMSPKKH